MRRNRRIEKQRISLAKKVLAYLIWGASCAFVGGIVALLMNPTLREIAEKEGMCKMASPDRKCKIIVSLDPLNQEIILWR